MDRLVDYGLYFDEIQGILLKKHESALDGRFDF